MKQGQMLFFSFCLVGLFSASGYAMEHINSETRQAANQTGAGSVAEISFDSGSAALSDGAKSDLNQLIAEAKSKGVIKEVRVVTWADQEYPPKGAVAPAAQVDLAQKRADAVQSLLQKEYDISSVKTINMARRPSEVQRMVNTKSAQTKSALETSGAAPTISEQTGFFGLKSKASHALVMIYYK